MIINLLYKIKKTNANEIRYQLIKFKNILKSSSETIINCGMVDEKGVAKDNKKINKNFVERGLF